MAADYLTQGDPESQDTEQSSPDILLQNTNFAEKLSDERLTNIGKRAKEGYEID